ncbi:hypothetical protein Desdi_1902 [Desulfitobacterium dichloroeliminans LMG P-21439]|uniref:Uncharacterized protein n=1 Tax=Desulfitobacterium dichloroeliminans (strain LMG P-21439 / DCA1) TaxID=871963 RepID=L0F9K6_DESDL|nr:hypothetical protein [Desulfitobacterium dichloroeliminans]AGA69351.1 hypothetical protein Desdi_1902 [Desulfitobacterium dichloroeliminans LMG P-21439]
MRKKTRALMLTLTSWIIVSLMLQFTFYYFLNGQVAKIMAPVIAQPIVVENLEAEIPGTNLENLQISYGKDYLAYHENGVLKVYNLNQEKVVFEKAPTGDGDYNKGVIYYQWLPDRDTLVYFFARKNPNPTTTVIVPIEEVNEQGTVDNSATTSPTTEPDAVEDPNQAPDPNPTTPEKPVKKSPKTRTEIRYNNPQITEVFTLELPPSEEEEIAPDDRYNRSIDSFPAGGEINQMVVSTFTNLLYLTIEDEGQFELMEIDIMKNVRNLNRAQETLTQLAASDKFGTLYAKSTSGQSERIIALQGWNREIISEDANDIILGNRAGTLYLGHVENDYLVSVRSAEEHSEEDNLEFKTIWEGSVPFDDLKKVIIGAKNEIIIYDDQIAHIIQDGKNKEIALSGEENYISFDGVELIQVTRVGMSTKIKLQPLQ